MVYGVFFVVSYFDTHWQFMITKTSMLKLILNF